MTCRKRDTVDIDDDVLITAKRHCAEAFLGTVRAREAQIWKRAGEALAEASSPCKRPKPCSDTVSFDPPPAGAGAPPGSIPFAPSSAGAAAPPELAHAADGATASGAVHDPRRVQDMVKGARAMKHAMETDLAACVPETLNQILRAALLRDRRLQQLRFDQEVQVMRAQVGLSVGATRWPWPESPTWAS